MTLVTLHDYAAALRLRYRAARRRDKGKILDEFCKTAGMERKSAIRLLNRESRPQAVRRGRPRKYGPEVVAPCSGCGKWVTACAASSSSP